MSRGRKIKQGAPSGTGNIEKRGKNTWRIRFFLGYDDESHKKLYSRSITVHGTKSEAREAAFAFRQELIEEAVETADALLTSEYVASWSRSRRTSSEVKQATIDRDAPVVNRILRYFGDTPLSELSVAMIRDAYAKAIDDDGLSENQLHTMHQKLKQILGVAKAEGKIAANPAANKMVKTPRPECTSRSSLSQEKAVELRFSSFLPCEQSRFIGIVIALATGCRRGEVLGLQWKHVHLGESPYIQIDQQLVDKAKGYEPPKAGSRRTIAIDEGTAETLRLWKESQARLMADTLEERIERKRKRDDLRLRRAQRLSEAHAELEYGLLQSDETAVVTDGLGEPFDPDNYGDWFRSFCCKHGFGKMVDDFGNALPPQEYNANGFPVDENGVPYSRSNPKPKTKAHYVGLKYHELRHTHLTLQIGNGMDVVTVQRRAGHKKPSTTLNFYSHAIPANDKNAARLIGGILKRPAGADAT